MKKTFSIFLIISFLFNVAGYLLIFLVLQLSLKNNVKENITAINLKHEKVLIVFAKTDMQKGIPELKFIDKKEFVFKGKMYDIIEKTETVDSTAFLCLADKNEDNLNLVFNKNVEDNLPLTNNTYKNILQKKTLDNGVIAANDSNLILFLQSSFNIHSDKINYFVFIRIHTPPPDYILV